MKRGIRKEDKPEWPVEEMWMRLENGTKTVRARADSALKEGRRRIRERPLTAVGAGVAAGAVVGVVAANLDARRRKTEAH